MVCLMGWTEETAKALAAAFDERGMSTRAIGEAIGRSHNYVWQRLGSRKTALSLEDIETLCAVLGINAEKLLRDSH